MIIIIIIIKQQQHRIASTDEPNGNIVLVCKRFYTSVFAVDLQINSNSSKGTYNDEQLI